MELYIEKFNADCLVHQRASLLIEYWSEQASSTMLPVHHSEVQEHPFGVLAEHEGCFGTMGYIAVKNLSEDGKVGHIGTLVTNPYYKQCGVASQCLDFLLENCKLYLPNMEEAFLYANECSAPLFVTKGGVIIGEREHPTSTNCNLVVDMTPALNNSKGL